jgi:Leucine-rich repeat (LRR) protein
MLRNLTDVLIIDFRANDIEEIESESFSECTKLEKIDLMENRLAKITKHIFSGNFEELQEINLSFNAIIGIESGSFDKLSSLVSIDLSGNCIRHLHSDLFGKCKDLMSVRLHHNDIIKIEFNLFSSKAHLKLLDLSHNHLDFVPEFEMKSIRRYVVSHNNITLLDLNYESRERRKLASIERLTVAFNNISRCAELREMRDDITHLDVSHNAITDLTEFPLLLNLEVLNLAHNNVRKLAVDDFDEKFPSLRALNISSNRNFDCGNYRFIRSIFTHIALAVDGNFTHHCSIDNDYDYYDLDMNARHHQPAESRTDEIVRQLKFNRTLLIILLSAIVIIAIIHTTFLLYQHLHRKSKANKREKLKEKLLIENIEL